MVFRGDTRHDAEETVDKLVGREYCFGSIQMTTLAPAGAARREARVWRSDRDVLP